MRLPAPPGDITAERRGDSVDIRFVVPAANADGSRPANVERVEVFALSGPATISDEEVMREGVRIATIDVKAPRDPDDTVEPDEPAGDVAEPEGSGLDQGATAVVTEALTDRLATGISPDSWPALQAPTLCEAAGLAARSYVAVGVSTSGRRGTRSRRVTVPLTRPPSAPAGPAIAYDESAVTVTWAGRSDQSAGTTPSVPDGLLPARTIGVCPVTFAYHVYDLTAAQEPDGGVAEQGSQEGKESGAHAGGLRLTKEPIAETRFVDERIEWGVKRCYAVGTVQVLNDARIESAPATPVCVTLTDTFPPPAPSNLRTVASEGAINLIWEASAAKDLAGYVVLRKSAVEDGFEAVTPAPIAQTSHRDTVESGGRYVYAVQAVDTAGNVSAQSPPAEETAR